jgi:hypothetical protein
LCSWNTLHPAGMAASFNSPYGRCRVPPGQGLVPRIHPVTCCRQCVQLNVSKYRFCESHAQLVRCKASFLEDSRGWDDGSETSGAQYTAIEWSPGVRPSNSAKSSALTIRVCHCQYDFFLGLVWGAAGSTTPINRVWPILPWRTNGAMFEF